MEVIQSFTIDHTHLKPGIYVSREDKGFTTYDLRITEPNHEPAMAPAAIHSIEHLMATWFRNSKVKEDVVYVGPMGCLTGMYIIMTGKYTVQNMRDLTIECLEWIITQNEVPATTPETCGNYLLMICRCAGGNVPAILIALRTIFTANIRSFRLSLTTDVFLLTHNSILHMNRISHAAQRLPSH